MSRTAPGLRCERAQITGGGVPGPPVPGSVVTGPPVPVTTPSLYDPPDPAEPADPADPAEPAEPADPADPAEPALDAAALLNDNSTGAA